MAFQNEGSEAEVVEGEKQAVAEVDPQNGTAFFPQKTELFIIGQNPDHIIQEIHQDGSPPPGFQVFLRSHLATKITENLNCLLSAGIYLKT